MKASRLAIFVPPDMGMGPTLVTDAIALYNQQGGSAAPS
jgi:hypothetical protein